MRIWGKSFKETLSFFGVKRRTACLGVILPVIGAGLGLFFLGRERAMEELKLMLLFSFAPILTVFVLVFLWNLWLAPYRILEERLEELDPSGSSEQKTTPVEPIDPDDWKGISAFKLGDAACLWVGVRPHNPIVDVRAEALFKRLSAASIKGDLHIVRGPLSNLTAILSSPEIWWPSYNQIVSAMSLRRYADNQQETVPPFLKSVKVPTMEPKLVDTAGSGEQ